MSEKVLKDFPSYIGGEPVDVVEARGLTQDVFINKYVRKNRPCLIKRAVTDWPALKKWKEKQYLSDLVGEYELDVYSQRNYLDFKKRKANVKKMSFSEGLHLAHKKDDSVVSMPANTIDSKGQFRELEGDMGVFSFLDSQPKPHIYDKNRFFAYKGAGTSWHQHPFDETLMCQIVGAKKVALLCSTNPDYNLLEQAFRKDDHDKYQLLLKKNSNYLSVITVEEGDSLYIPPYWFHGIDPVDSDFGVTLAHCWKSYLFKFGEMRYPINKVNLLSIITNFPYIFNYTTLLIFKLCALGFITVKINKLKSWLRF
jgi:ribosomal protein L16 Arg81 hydroxylase